MRSVFTFVCQNKDRYQAHHSLSESTYQLGLFLRLSGWRLVSSRIGKSSGNGSNYYYYLKRNRSIFYASQYLTNIQNLSSPSLPGTPDNPLRDKLRVAPSVQVYFYLSIIRFMACKSGGFCPTLGVHCSTSF